MRDQVNSVLKMRNLAHLVCLIVAGSIMCVFGESTNDTCTAEYMNDLLERALEIKEQYDLTGIYDCCKVLLAIYIQWTSAKHY